MLRHCQSTQPWRWCRPCQSKGYRARRLRRHKCRLLPRRPRGRIVPGGSGDAPRFFPRLCHHQTASGTAGRSGQSRASHRSSAADSVQTPAAHRRCRQWWRRVHIHRFPARFRKKGTRSIRALLPLESRACAVHARDCGRHAGNRQQPPLPRQRATPVPLRARWLHQALRAPCHQAAGVPRPLAGDGAAQAVPARA